LPPLPATGPPATTARKLSKALWVWNTRELMDRPEQRAEFLSFLDTEGFDQVYLQLPNRTGMPARLASGAAGPTPLRSLVAAIRGLGLAVHALDGHATFVLPDKQDQVLGTIRDVAAFNAAGPEGERFSGVHYDIEPYLLPGFGGSRREELLTRYLELLARMAVEVRKTDLRLGVDLPFWYDAPDEFSRELLTVAFAGQRKVVTEHVLDLVDHATLMDYRTSAYGPDGILFHAAGELEYAARVGKQITIGLETGKLPDEVYLTFAGEGRTGMPSGSELGEWVLLSTRGAESTLYLVRQNQRDPFQRFLAARPGLRGDLRFWAVSGRLEIPAAKLSFAELGSGRLITAMRQVEYELRTSSSFAGFALHHYASLRELGPPNAQADAPPPS
ncbi:MAG: hypothetical protein GY856_22395, partial [bacterium]|nr:hypothetical protein [bacterium]